MYNDINKFASNKSESLNNTDNINDNISRAQSNIVRETIENDIGVNTDYDNSSASSTYAKVEDYSTAAHYSSDPEERKIELLQRLKIKTKIIQYQETFPKQLICYQYKMDKLDTLSNEDLVIFLDEIRIAVRNRNSLNMTKSIYFGACDFLEKAGNMFNYNIKGFKNILYTNQEVHDCLNEIALEYEDTIQLPATVRLPFITFQLAMSLYQVRKIDTVINVELQKPIKPEIVELYEDL